MVVNAVENAIEHTPKPASIVLELHLRGNSPVLAVADNGPGIPIDQQERVFERFEQVEAGTRPSRGIGLGLALCKEFVEMHGGRIWVESREGVGSTFTFTLPIRRDRTDR